MHLFINDSFIRIFTKFERRNNKKLPNINKKDFINIRIDNGGELNQTNIIKFFCLFSTKRKVLVLVYFGKKIINDHDGDIV